VRLIRERAAAEAAHDPAPLHGETITIAIELEIG
jgi:hypothetical protein